MKRLLEWKQRMLQSPLTRKTSPRPDSAPCNSQGRIQSPNPSPQSRTDPESLRQQVTIVCLYNLVEFILFWFNLGEGNYIYFINLIKLV